MNGVWFLDVNNMERFKLEREAIEHLQETAQWLQGIQWKLDRQICVEAVLDIEGNNYEVRMIYPDLFPTLPPSVYPKDNQVRWSTHQYGVGGHLCLEWRPDTWSPEVTGAQVLESAYKLLYIEQPLNNDLPQIAPSDHEVTVGQALRFSIGRLYTPSNLVAYLRKIPTGTQGTLKFSIHSHSQSFLTLIHEIWDSEAKLWQDNTIPDEMSGSSKNTRLYSGVVYSTSLNKKDIRDIQNFADLNNIIYQIKANQQGLTNGNIWSSDSENVISSALLIDSTGHPHFFIWFDSSSNQIYRLSLIESQYRQNNPRIPRKLQNLSSKSVAIIGLGSVGSKIAISLARTGIRQFHLIDDDIFLPENVCRNALDWRNVGEHKVHAISQYLSFLNRDIKVACSVLNIGGQESSAFLDRTLKKISQCDLIIDATAIQ